MDDSTADYGAPTKDELRSKQQFATEVFTKYEELKEHEDGYSFAYPQRENWGQRLSEYVADAQRRFPGIDFRVAGDDENQRIWLHVRGSDRVKEMFRDYLQIGPSTFRPRSVFHETLRWRLRVLTNRLRVLPDFIIIGAARCGTSSLYDYLTEHPVVASASKKETNFFDRIWARGMSRYRAFFPTVFEKYARKATGRSFVTGEATPCYLFHPLVAKRVRENVPGAKLIALLRNPVDRAYSHYHLKLSTGYERLSFEEAIDKEEERLEGELERIARDHAYSSFPRLHFSYLSRGVYVDQLKAWTDRFPREQLLILSAEEFMQRRAETYERVLDFLGLPPYSPKTYRKVHAIPYPEMAPATRKRLKEYFRPHNERLWEFLGVDYGWNE